MKIKFLICIAISSSFIISSCGRKLLNSPEGIEASATSKSNSIRNNLVNNSRFSASDINTITSVFDNLNSTSVTSSGNSNTSGYKNYSDDSARTEFFEDAGFDSRSSVFDSIGSGYSYSPSGSEADVVAVAIPEKELNLSEGEKRDIEATVYYRDASMLDNNSINWTSSDPDIVKVDNYGNIEALSKGEAIVTARASDNATRYEDVKITVKSNGTNDE